MSNWAYVAIAYTVVWGGLAVYGVALARRVAQARRVARELNEVVQGSPAHSAPPHPEGTRHSVDEQDSAVCDAPPAP